MMERIDNLLWSAKAKCMQGLELLRKEEKGASDIVAIIVIIVVVIGVAGLFWDSLETAVEAVFTKLTDFIDA